MDVNSFGAGDFSSGIAEKSSLPFWPIILVLVVASLVIIIAYNKFLK